MPVWLTSLLFAVLVATIPFTLILRILLQLPRASALSHRRWPLPMIFSLIGAVTACITVFIRFAYYGRSTEPLAGLMQFVIASLVYAFSLALVLRQFSGVYPEYIVTAGRMGLSLRKTAYRNIVDVEERAGDRGEVHLIVTTSHGRKLWLPLPARDVGIFYELLKREP